MEGSRLETLEDRVKKLEDLVEETKAEIKKVERGSTKSHRKPISEYKVIQNVAP